MSTSGTGDVSNLFDLYVKDVMSLARTMVIKFDQVAEATNNLVISRGGHASIDEQDKRSWKYFQNISGVYNSTDTPMYIQSLDGNGEILFSKANLATNPGTKAAYVYGSYFYRELVAKYPDQEPLILGIIYPVDIDVAIGAKDGTILSYPSFLVEEAEVDFISKLQGWIYDYVQRWIVKAYALTDELFVPMYVAQLTMNMIPAIMNIRLSACKTNQAHSFHIGQYLRSHGFLDFYLSELTREQTLAFYRNIRYYVRTGGFTGTFDDLVELLLTKRGLPAYEYVFKQNDSSIAYIDPNDVSDIYPRALFERRPINAPAEAQIQSSLTLSDVFGVIKEAAPKNTEWRAGHEEAVAALFKDSPSSKLNTKVIEVGLPLSAINAARTPEFIYAQEWMALAATGVYTPWIVFTPPGTDAPLQLTQPRALALWAYAMNRIAGPDKEDGTYHHLNRVPFVAIDEAAPRTAPDQVRIRNAVSPLVTDALFDEMMSYVTLAPATLTTVEAFKSYCGELYAKDQAQYRLYSSQENPRTRAQLQFVSDQVHESFTAGIAGLTIPATAGNPEKGILYSDFFNAIGFNPSGYSGDEFMELATLIFKNATGFDLDSVDNPLNIQKAMVSLMKQLSSYSVLFVTNTELNRVTSVPTLAVRISDVRERVSESDFVDTAPVTVLGLTHISGADSIKLDWAYLYPLNEPGFSVRETSKYDIQKVVTRDSGHFANDRAFVETGVLIQSNQDIYAQYNSLSSAQLQQLDTRPISSLGI